MQRAPAAQSNFFSLLWRSLPRCPGEAAEPVMAKRQHWVECEACPGRMFCSCLHPAATFLLRHSTGSRPGHRHEAL